MRESSESRKARKVAGDNVAKRRVGRSVAEPNIVPNSFETKQAASNKTRTKGVAKRAARSPE